MLKSCRYCGRIHDSNFDCGRKPKRMKKRTDKDRFRNMAIWQRKREEIKERDLHLCQACIRNFKGTIRKYEYEGLSVHHIVGLEEDFEKRLDNDNLITLCQLHHEMAEAGVISKEQLFDFTKENGEIHPPA